MAHPALHSDGAAVLLHDAPADGQPEARAADRADIAPVELLELLEELAHVLGSDAAAPVGDAKLELRAGAARGHRAPWTRPART